MVCAFDKLTAATAVSTENCALPIYKHTDSSRLAHARLHTKSDNIILAVMKQWLFITAISSAAAVVVINFTLRLPNV